MSNNHSKPNFEEINNTLENLKSEWSETLEVFNEAKDATKNEDIFDELNYLTICDEIKKNLYDYLKELEPLKKTLVHSKKEIGEKATNTLNNLEEFKAELIKIFNGIEEEYPELSDTILRKAQDLITSFSAALQTEKIAPSLKTEISQSLDKDVFLQEMKDSLEAYRETREQLVSETPVGALKTPDGHIPEDVGEEYPEYDSVLSQLDTVITACDSAILTQDISE